ncbi:MAG: calcium/proton exchanger [Candidatus Dormibacteraceae bacterium]
MRPSLNWLLVFVPISVVADLFVPQPVLIFATSALAVLPLAGLIGTSTEQLAIRVGPGLGGLLNATLGNLTELIVGILLVNAGELAIVKATLIGSIVGNLLLVLGLSFLLGGVRFKEQKFNQPSANVHSASLVLAVGGLLIPALLTVTSPSVGVLEKEIVSAVVAVVLIGLYLATLVFTRLTHAHIFHVPGGDEAAEWSTRRAVAGLTGAALLVGLESEFLVSSLNPALRQLHVPPMFVGLILIPVIGNAAEHSSAIFFALTNRVDVTIEIAVGSSTQIAMFVAPALVFISLLMGRPMDFVFTGFEVAIVGLASLIFTVTAHDGRSNWLEGLQLIGLYTVIAIAAYFVLNP